MSVFAGSIVNIYNVIVMSYCAWLGWILRGVNMTMKPPEGVPPGSTGVGPVELGPRAPGLCLAAGW